MRFLDTNVLLRYLTRDDEEKARRALELFSKVERGDEKVVVSPMVVFETVFTLQKRYRVPRHQIRDSLGDILSLRGFQLANKHLYERALELYASKNVSFADAFNAVYMRSQGLSEIYSWDSDFDKLGGFDRVEPGERPNP